MTDLAAAADHTTVSIGFGDDWSDTRRLVHCASPELARRLLARRGPSWQRRYGAMFQCEIEQHEAALAIGVDSESMCFRLEWRRAKPTGQLTRRWFGTEPALLIRHSGPKLAIAAIYGAPMRPTPFDLERLSDFGYAGIDVLATRIHAWNASGSLPALPVPLSSVQRPV